MSIFNLTLKELLPTKLEGLTNFLSGGILIQTFNNYDIPIIYTSASMRGNFQGKLYEIGIVAHSDKMLIVVEVKTTLRQQQVKHFIKKLDQAKTWLKQYTNNHIYGAMAFLHADAQAQEMAIKQKLFAIRATGDSAHIVNTPEFKPRVW